MNNLIISISYLLLSFILTIIAYKYFGKIGLITWMCILLIISNIQTMKVSNILGFSVSLGNISYGGTFLATDLLNEKYGKKVTKQAILLSFLIMIMFCLSMSLFLEFEPSELDVTQNSLLTIFHYLPRITITSLIAYFISQHCDAFLYDTIRQKTKVLWIKNYISTVVSQILDTMIFTLGAFLGVLSFANIVEIAITMLIFKIIIALLDIPFMYFATGLKVRELS